MGIGGRLIAAQRVSKERNEEGGTYSSDCTFRTFPILGIIPYPRVELCEFLPVSPGQCADVRHVAR